MQLVSQETSTDGMVTLVVKADPEEVRLAVDGVYRDLARRANIPGFRKGRAPRALLEQQVSIEEARGMAAEDLAAPAVVEGLKQAGIEPFTIPKLDKTDLEADGSAAFTATVLPKPPIELGEYQGLQALRPAVEVTEEQVEGQIYHTRERHARYEPVTDRAAESGDLALVDYDLVIAGEVVEGQSTHGYPCQTGGDTLFPELNEKLPGLKPGEQARIPASFPPDHPDAALAGKEGEYVVTLGELKTRAVPELTDEMARETHGVESADELRQAVRQLLEKMAGDEAEDRLRGELVDQVVAGSRVTVPLALVRREAAARLDQLETDLRGQGRSLQEYLRERGLEVERWLRNEEVDARGDLERMLVLDEIARREGIEVTEEEISDEVSSIAQRIGSSSDRLRRRLKERDLDRLTDRIQRHKVLQFLVDHADITNEGEAAPAARQTAAESQEEQP